MFKPTCNFLFITSIDMSVSKITLILKCSKQRNDVNGDIFTSEDMQNVTRILDVVSYEIYEWHNLQ